MTRSGTFAICAVLSATSLCGGCAVPRYDVPYTEHGQPTVASIVSRVECEIRDMVRDDRPDDPASFHRLTLLNGDYDAEVSLSLEVNDTGGLSASSTYAAPLSRAASFMFTANGVVSESRDHNFTENIQLSTRTIFDEWKSGSNTHDCPVADTNLSGDLALRDIVAMAALSRNKDLSQKLSGKGVFGGSVQFLVTKNLSAVGPSWTLRRFKTLSGLANLSEINTDKVTIAFAQGPNAGKKLMVTKERALNPYAYSFLQQLLTSSITNQLSILQGTLQP